MTKETESQSGAALLTELSAQEKLMLAAQKFAAAFDQDRRWPDNFARLSYTLQTWKELALSAVEFSRKTTTPETLSQQP